VCINSDVQWVVMSLEVAVAVFMTMSVSQEDDVRSLGLSTCSTTEEVGGDRDETDSLGLRLQSQGLGLRLSGNKPNGLGLGLRLSHQSQGLNGLSGLSRLSDRAWSGNNGGSGARSGGRGEAARGAGSVLREDGVGSGLDIHLDISGLGVSLEGSRLVGSNGGAESILVSDIVNCPEEAIGVPVAVRASDNSVGITALLSSVTSAILEIRVIREGVGLGWPVVLLVVGV